MEPASAGPPPTWAAGCLWRVVFGRLGRNCSSLELLGHVARLRRVDADARAHGRGQRDLTDVAALRRRRLRPHDLLDERRVVLEQCPLVEAALADREVDVRAAVGP